MAVLIEWGYLEVNILIFPSKEHQLEFLGNMNLLVLFRVSI